MEAEVHATLTSLAMQMTNKPFALAFWVVCLAGAIGGFFIHALICLFPILYKKMKESQSFDETEATLNTLYDAVKIPFYTQFALLVFGSSLMYIVAIILGYLVLPAWTIVLTPLSLMLIGIFLRILKRDWFYDLPGIVMPSIGLGLFGLLAAINFTFALKG